MTELLKKSGYLLLALMLNAFCLVWLILVFLPQWLWKKWLSGAQSLRYSHRGMYAEMAQRMKEKRKNEN